MGRTAASSMSTVVIIGRSRVLPITLFNIIAILSQTMRGLLMLMARHLAHGQRSTSNKGKENKYENYNSTRRQNNPD